MGEILQQGARLNAPQAALLQEYEKYIPLKAYRFFVRRVKAKMPSLTEEEFWRLKSRMTMAGSIAAMTATHLSRPYNRYSSVQQGKR